MFWFIHQERNKQALARLEKTMAANVHKQKEEALVQWLEDLWKDLSDYENIDHIQMGIEEAIDYVKSK